jgi:alpha/beta superfamily hydrolase
MPDDDTSSGAQRSRETLPPSERDHDIGGGRRVRQLVMASATGSLEAVLFCRADEHPTAVAVFCHPHPQFGGSMHNKVAYRAAEALFGAGLPTLRFNFRGVGRSEGEWSGGPGEEEDAASAIGYMLGLYPGRRLLLGGFSFGAGVALAVGARDARVSALLAVAPGAGRRDLSFLARSTKPKAVIQGTADELCPLPDLEATFPSWADPKWLRLIDGAGHFFEQRMPELQQAVRDALHEPSMATALDLDLHAVG